MSAMEYVPDAYASQQAILCAECGAVIEPNGANLCIGCLRNSVDISDGIPKETSITFCRGCERWFSPPGAWMTAQPESRELLCEFNSFERRVSSRVVSVCLRFIGLNVQPSVLKRSPNPCHGSGSSTLPSSGPSPTPVDLNSKSSSKRRSSLAQSSSRHLSSCWSYRVRNVLNVLGSLPRTRGRLVCRSDKRSTTRGPSCFWNS